MGLIKVSISNKQRKWSIVNGVFVFTIYYLLFTLFVVLPAHAFTPWAASSAPFYHAVDYGWRDGGLGAIPNRTTICSSLGQAGQAPTFVQNVTAAQINSAIAGCQTGEVVFLNAGTYNLTSPINILRSNVTLRGAGANQTLLYFNGSMQNTCDNAGGDICIYNGNGWWSGGPGTTANWTGTSEGGPGLYPQGATHITLDNTTGLSVGAQLILDQLGDNGDTGNIYQGQNNTSQTASTCQSCNNPGRPSRPQTPNGSGQFD